MPCPVAILCPGPSLPRSWPTAKAGVTTIAVNSAIQYRPGGVAPDWWCGMDRDLWSMTRLLGMLPAVGYCGDMQDLLLEKNLPSLHYHDLRGELHRHPYSFRRWSTPAAIYFAVAQLDATEIELHGADMAGAADFTGEIGGNRSPARWEQERIAIAEVSGFAGQIGCTVKFAEIEQVAA